MKEFIEKNKKKCSKIIPGGFKPTNNIFSTNFAKSLVGFDNECWPRYNDKPLTFICQINLEEAPCVPSILSDIKLLSFFIDLDSYLDNEDEKTWEIRTYENLEDLVEKKIIQTENQLKPFECKFELSEIDLPIYDDPNINEVDGVDSTDIIDDSNHYYFTKIGGWSSNIQHEQNWYNLDDNIEFALQIGSEEKVRLNWCDAGNLYIGRSMENNKWYVEMQFY